MLSVLLNKSHLVDFLERLIPSRTVLEARSPAQRHGLPRRSALISDVGAPGMMINLTNMVGQGQSSLIALSGPPTNPVPEPLQAVVALHKLHRSHSSGSRPEARNTSGG